VESLEGLSPAVANRIFQICFFERKEFVLDPEKALNPLISSSSPLDSIDLSFLQKGRNLGNIGILLERIVCHLALCRKDSLCPPLRILKMPSSTKDEHLVALSQASGMKTCGPGSNLDLNGCLNVTGYGVAKALEKWGPKSPGSVTACGGLERLSLANTGMGRGQLSAVIQLLSTHRIAQRLTSRSTPPIHARVFSPLIQQATSPSNSSMVKSEGPVLNFLKELDLNNCGPAVNAELLEAFAWACPHLEVLSLADCWNVDDEALVAITAPRVGKNSDTEPLLSCLMILDLGGIRGLTNLGVARLAKLQKLKSLSLSRGKYHGYYSDPQKITELGIKRIMSGCPNLEYINLRGIQLEESFTKKYLEKKGIHAVH